MRLTEQQMEEVEEIDRIHFMEQEAIFLGELKG